MIIFHYDPKTEPSRFKFTALFIHQDCYTKLLELCNNYFNTHLLDPAKRELPLPASTYLLLDRKPNFKHIGKHCKIMVSGLIYNRRFNILVATVKLRKNFTCNNMPHIVLAKEQPNITNDLVNVVLNSNISYINENAIVDFETRDQLYVSGRIGVMMDEGLMEEPYIKIPEVVPIVPVARPEVTHSIERNLKRDPNQNQEQ